MKTLSEILKFLKPDFKEKSVSRYSRLREKSVLMKDILSEDRMTTAEEIDFIRFHFLNLIDVVCAGTNNSEVISRMASDQTISSTLRAVVLGEPDSRITTLKQLPSVGARSAICVLAFLFPKDYAVFNRGILTFLRLANEEFKIARLPDDLAYSSKIVELGQQLNYQSSLEFSLEILMAIEKIITTRVKKMPRSLFFEDKLEFKLNWILKESELENI